MPTGLDLGSAGELHHILVAWFQGELEVWLHWLPLSLPGNGPCSLSPHMTLAKPSTLLGTARSGSTQVLLLQPSVYENLLCCMLCMYVGVMFGVQILLWTQKENVMPH